jgi:hypothetical protein
MDSGTFFKGAGDKFKGKSGIYVFKSPMKYQGNDIYKIGYAYQSLYNRIANFRTAYGPITFKLCCVYAIPERIVNAPRTMWALGTEKQLHNTLLEKAVSRNEENGKLEGEWFYDIGEIMKVVRNLILEHRERITNADKWELYIEGGFTERATKSQAKKKLEDITSSNSQFNSLQVRPKSARNTPKKLDSNFEYEENKSRNRVEDVNYYIGPSAPKKPATAK